MSNTFGSMIRMTVFGESHGPAVGVVLVLLVPMIGNYYLVDALARSGSVPWHYLALAVVVTLPAIIAFLLLGVGFAARTGERP